MRRPLPAFGLAAGLYLLLTIALTWPLVLHMGSHVPNDLGDSLLNTFILSWNARVVPFTAEWWNLPQFHPIPGVMAFSEHLLGLSVLTTPVILATGNPLLGYNVAFFVSFPLCALFAHLLCYELTRRHDASLIAGIAYGFGPYRMSQFSHVQVLSAYWIPLALLALHLFLRRGEWRWAALFAVSWYLQALANGYYLFYLSVLVALWLLWFVVGQGRWRELGRIAVAWVTAGLGLVPVALGYWKWQHAYGFQRWPDEIQAFSADVASILTAPANVRVWGWLDVVQRPESQLFPGATILGLVVAGIILAWTAAAREGMRQLRAPRILLAAAAVFAFAAATPLLFGPWRLEIFGVRLLSVGTPQKPLSVATLLGVMALAMHPSIRTGWRRRSPLAFYVIAAFVMWLFCLGPAPTLMNEPLLYKAPYSWLLLFPGVDGVRVPARFWILATMCLAVAAGLAVVHVLARWPALGRALPASLSLLLLVEAWPEPLRVIPPPDPRPSHTRALTRLDLPIHSGHDLISLYRAVQHERPLWNGYSGYFAPHYWAMQHLLATGDRSVLEYMTAQGSLEVMIDHDNDRADYWKRYVGGVQYAEVAHSDDAYTSYRLPRSGATFAPAVLSGTRLPIAGIEASLYQELVALMTDGDRITRWHTGGPQDPTNEMVIDLGHVRRIAGVEMQIGGYVADFPRDLTIDVSSDRSTWQPGWSGETAFIAFQAALQEPLLVPLRFPLKGAEGRYLRMRQTARDRTYYWSISELHIIGD